MFALANRKTMSRALMKIKEIRTSKKANIHKHVQNAQSFKLVQLFKLQISQTI